MMISVNYLKNEFWPRAKYALGHSFCIKCLNLLYQFEGSGFCDDCLEYVYHHNCLSLKKNNLSTVQTPSSNTQSGHLPSNLQQTHSLVHWPVEDLTISRFAYFLKSPAAELTWSFWSKVFIKSKQLDQKISPDEKCIFVPIPSRSRKKHSWYFAVNLKNELECQLIFAQMKIINLLQFSKQWNYLDTEQKEQKKKSLNDRKKIKFDLNEDRFAELSSCFNTSKNYRVVIVDDICTSGATRDAALQTLTVGLEKQKISAKIEFWCLIKRDKVSQGLELAREP